MVLELNSTQDICAEEPEVAVRCHAEKKALHKLTKCSYFKQQALFIILLNSTALETFRIEHIVAAAVHSGTDIRSPLLVFAACLQLRNGRLLPLFFPF